MTLNKGFATAVHLSSTANRGGTEYLETDAGVGDDRWSHHVNAVGVWATRMSFNTFATGVQKMQLAGNVLSLVANVSKADKGVGSPKKRMEAGGVADVVITHIDDFAKGSIEKGIKDFKEADEDLREEESTGLAWAGIAGNDIISHLKKAGIVTVREALEASKLSLVSEVVKVMLACERQLLGLSRKTDETYSPVIVQRGNLISITFIGLSVCTYALAASLFETNNVRDVIVDFVEGTVEVQFTVAHVRGGRKRKRDGDEEDEDDEDERTEDGRRVRSKGLLQRAIEAALPGPSLAGSSS